MQRQLSPQLMPTNDAAQWVKVGVVGRAHGLKGAFFVSYREDAIPKSYRNVRIGESPQQSENFEIRASKMMSGRPLLECGGFTQREHAESFVGKPIWVHRSQISLDETKEYIWSDLIGKPVVDVSGKILGQISEVRNYGASDVVAIKDPQQGTLEVPLVPSYFDMSFSRTCSEIKLIVGSDAFTGLWSAKDDA